MSDTPAGLSRLVYLWRRWPCSTAPLGGYLARVFTSERDLRVERVVYGVVGVDPRADQRSSVYAESVIAFSFVGVVGLYALQRFQSQLPWSLGLAMNTGTSSAKETGNMVDLDPNRTKLIEVVEIGKAAAPLALRGVQYTPSCAGSMLRPNPAIYGLGGIPHRSSASSSSTC